ncbi:unnamed protein product [Ambrosiozyma monospora]|uniref:3-ketodihydrosphingosine reductase TSC10 n=1 Tax=Ambrosiozyma monospora TaxID=43982 RepID=A0A9W7DJC0_AMBMO|nr:unnamed protein product [Ambrosiozyma monospora]
MAIFGNNKFPVKDKLVLVTGASQGLGYALSQKLYEQGASVILIARNKTKLASNVDHIIKSTPNASSTQFVEYISADLTIYEENIKILNYLKSKNYHPDILFCLAGSSHPGFFMELTPDDLSQGIDINYKTALYFIHALSKYFVQSKSQPGQQKHIVLCSSTVAFYHFTGYIQYSPMKTAIKALGDSLRQELKPYGVKVSTLFPGNFASEGYTEENLTKPAITQSIEGASQPITVEQCADKVLYWLNKGDHYVFTDLISWVLASFSLGFNPRNFGVLQVFVAFVGAVVARFVGLLHEHDVQVAFDKLGGFAGEGKNKKDDVKQEKVEELLDDGQTVGTTSIDSSSKATTDVKK